jgi:hypothetical protein
MLPIIHDVGTAHSIPAVRTGRSKPLAGHMNIKSRFGRLQNSLSPKAHMQENQL